MEKYDQLRGEEYINEYPPYSPQDLRRREATLTAAKLMLNAALTAPVAGGVPQIEAHMVYGQEEMEKARQQLVDYPWQEKGAKERKVVFLHLPKVEIVSDDLDIRAVALAGGREVAKAAGVAADYFEKKAEKPSKQKPSPSKVV